MAEAKFATKVRAPRIARPRPDADVAAITADISARYPKTLEYLGR